MTETEKLLAHLDNRIAQIQQLKEIVLRAEGEINAAVHCPTLGSSPSTLALHIKDVSAGYSAARNIARAMEGRWRRERRDGFFDYIGEVPGCDHPIRIFGAEVAPVESEPIIP